MDELCVIYMFMSAISSVGYPCLIEGVLYPFFGGDVSDLSKWGVASSVDDLCVTIGDGYDVSLGITMHKVCRAVLFDCDEFRTEVDEVFMDDFFSIFNYLFIMFSDVGGECVSIRCDGSFLIALVGGIVEEVCFIASLADGICLIGRGVV